MMLILWLSAGLSAGAGVRQIAESDARFGVALLLLAVVIGPLGHLAFKDHGRPPMWQPAPPVTKADHSHPSAA